MFPSLTFTRDLGIKLFWSKAISKWGSIIPSKHLKLEFLKLHFTKVSVEPGVTVSSAGYTSAQVKLSSLSNYTRNWGKFNTPFLRSNITSFSDKKSKPKTPERSPSFASITGIIKYLCQGYDNKPVVVLRLLFSTQLTLFLKIDHIDLNYLNVLLIFTKQQP